jgi:ubiquitin C-terminal hydrolase
MKFYKKGHSLISDLFCGVFTTENYCKKCNKILSFTYHSFKIIDLPLYNLAKNNNYISLDITCLFKEFFSEKEILNLFCEKCNKKYYTKTNIYCFPKYLIIHLERKVDNYYIKNEIKNIQTINFAKFLEEEKPNNFNYNLKSTIYHSFDSSNIGHYTSTCLIDDKWYYFDDNKFYFSIEYIKYKEDNSILLFYEKK